MNMDDRSYYRKRALQEAEAARAATCEQARERHVELAAAYALRGRDEEVRGGDETGSEGFRA
jgi:hypothetical protein